MRIQYDPQLVEHAVQYAAQRDPVFEAQLHREMDPLYELANHREKEESFRRHFMELFRVLRLDRVVEELLAVYPMIGSTVSQCIVLEALRARRQSAELFVKSDSGRDDVRTIVLRVSPAALWNADDLAVLRRDLLQAADMLDSAFGYDKDSLAGGSPRENLVRDRYRVLWDISAHGRLARDESADARAMRALVSQLQRVYAGITIDTATQVGERLLDARHVTHDQLLQWAATPEQLLNDPESPQAQAPTVKAATCPLCHFATQDWIDSDQVTPNLARSVQRDYPDWNAAMGICRQCADLYAQQCTENQPHVQAYRLGA